MVHRSAEDQNHAMNNESLFIRNLFTISHLAVCFTLLLALTSLSTLAYKMLR